MVFRWPPSPSTLFYDVLIARDEAYNSWTRVSDTQYTVRDVVLYDSITIHVRTPGSSVDNRITYNGSDYSSSNILYY